MDLKNNFKWRFISIINIYIKSTKLWHHHIWNNYNNELIYNTEPNSNLHNLNVNYYNTALIHVPVIVSFNTSFAKPPYR